MVEFVTKETLKEYENFINGRPTKYEVTLKMLETMA